MRLLLCVSIAFCFVIQLSAQELPVEKKVHIESVKFSETITADDLKSYLTILASDDFQGRETGTPGNEKAAHFLAEKLKSFGVSPIPGTESYFQEVAFTRMKWTMLNLKINSRDIQHKREYVMVPTLNPNAPTDISASEVVFLGYGIDDSNYSDYRGQRVQDNVALIYAGEPRDSDGNFRITSSKEPSVWSENLERKLEAAKKAGVKALVIIDDKIRDKAGRYRGELIGGTTLMGPPDEFGEEFPPNFWLSPTVAKELLGKKMKKVIKARKKIEKKGKYKSVLAKAEFELKSTKRVTSMPGVNVIAYIEGSDPVMKEEVVIISAHYDHIGMRGEDIFNGADDNGSGTSGVLEIAQAFQLAKNNGAGPKRSILCLFVTGEEKGLLGSQFYAEHPIFPLEKTVADINIDMIGRVDDKHEDENYIYVIGSDRLSTQLHQINEESNNKYTNLELDYTYNAEDDPNRFYYRSDHYNFAKNGIPSIFFFSGTHADYHRPTDTIEKIRFGKAAKITKLAFFNAWELANRRERIKVDVKPKT